MEKLFQVLGCPDNFKTRLAAFKLERDALSWWTAHLRTQVGGDAYADTCTWATFREIFYNRQARHFKWGLKRWVLDRIVNTEYPNVAQVCAAARNIELLHESGPSNKRDRDGNRIQHRGQGNQEYRGRSDQVQEYRGQSDQDQSYRGQHDRRQEQKGHDYRASNRSGNDCQGHNGNNNRKWKDQAVKGNQQNRHSGSSSQQKPVEALPPPPLCTTCGKAHPGPCFKATGGCFSCCSTTHKIKDCPKRNPVVPGNCIKPPPTTGRVYTTTREQAEHSSERLDVEMCIRGFGGYWASMKVESNLMLQIKEAQKDDGELWAVVQNVEEGKQTEFRVDDDGVVWYEDRLCVPNDPALPSCIAST
ncbi:hypothetical protein CTI12_AA069770 [Artemisia annua]|uniref:Zinc finger, CCHC-type, Retrotransposon gag domain protein n=1 Tax=Artemisia annua TaxID=35608 RepID=A0A2U1Q665_ARTAN|nr:hypothetical protein CTI12_AA069770 [Artemisia annua]